MLQSPFVMDVMAVVDVMIMILSCGVVITFLFLRRARANPDIDIGSYLGGIQDELAMAIKQFGDLTFRGSEGVEAIQDGLNCLSGCYREVES
jgi:hypothetical protein